MQVLLTGATGLLGHNVLARLVAEGCDVVCAVRRAGGIKVPPGPRWREVVADPTRPVPLVAAARGCDAIVNCAGMTDMAVLSPAEYRPANVDICRAVCEAAKRWGIGVVVHVSTVNTIGCGSADRPADEATPPGPPFSTSAYARSKAEGERVMDDFAQAHPECRVVVLCPGYMLGPYDVRPSSGRLLALAYRRPVAFAPKGGKAFVAADDVAGAVWGALREPSAAGRYIVTNRQAELSFAELYRMQSSTLGYVQRVVEVPNWVLRAAGRVGDALRAMRMRTALSTANVRQLMAREHYDNRRARLGLGLKETPLPEAIRQFHQWYNTQHEQ